jgi:excisionase family DNA binding protein
VNRSPVAPAMYRPDEVAAILGISIKSVYRRIADGTLRSVPVGGLHRIPRVWLDAYVAGTLEEAS